MKRAAKSRTGKYPAFGSTVLRTASSSDSMGWAKQELASQPHGTLLLPERFTAARGRQGRTWSCADGQLLLTYIIKPNVPTISKSDRKGGSPLLYLYYALNVGICNALRTVAPSVNIKWPNDMVLGGKKVGGMLLEPVWSGEKLDGLVLGIGLNINNRFKESDELFRVATSIHDQIGSNRDLDGMQKTLNRELTTWYKEWLDKEYQMIWERWRGRHLPTGSRLTAHTADGTTIRGTLVEPLLCGTLVVDVAGTKHTLTIADILSITQ